MNLERRHALCRLELITDVSQDSEGHAQIFLKMLGGLLGWLVSANKALDIQKTKLANVSVFLDAAD